MHNSQPPIALQPLDPSFGWNLGPLLGELWRKAWLVALIALVAAALGVVFLLQTPKVYEARTVVQVEQQLRPMVSIQDGEREDLKTADVLKTIEQNLGNKAVLLRAAERMKLREDPRFTGEKPGLTARITALVKKPQGGALSEADLLRSLEGRVKVALRRGTRLVDVNARAQDPSLAKDLSLAVVSEYTRLQFEQRLESSRPVNDHLVAEAARLKAKLEKSEQDLQAYRESQRAVSLEESQNIVVETLKDLNKSLGEARSARIKLEAEAASLDAPGRKAADFLAVGIISASPEIVALKQRIAEQEGALASMAERYDSKNPKYLQARSEIEKLNLSLERALADAAELARKSLAAAKETEQKLLTALREQEQQALELNKIAIRYNVLNREVDSDRALYEAVLKQLKETEVVQGAGQEAVRIAEAATLPDRPVSPRKSIVLALALALGLGAGSLAAAGPALIKGPLVSAEDAERRLGLPALAVIPKTRAGGIVLVDDPRSPAAEAVRSMRALLSLNGAGGSSFLFTSALPEEGKTFCAVNFAAALALEGRRTLLVDADMRLPSVEEQLFDKGAPQPGLSDVLAGEIALAKAARPTSVENLHVLTAGRLKSGPAELLTAPRLSGLLTAILEEHDCVVIDTPPLLPVSDALRIAAHVAHPVLVARCGSTRGRAVQRAQHLLTVAAGKSPSGLVLNRAPLKTAGYGSYGSYGPRSA